MTDNKPKIVGYIAESDLDDLENEECHIGPVCIASDSWPGTVALIRLSDYEKLQAEHQILESELSTVKKVAYGNNDEQGGEWVRSDERLPTEADVDCYGTVIGWDSMHDQAVTMYPMAVKHRKGITHWKPTGLKRPQPPKELEE